MDQASQGRPGVGAFITLARQRKRISQRELSLRIGRSPAYVSKIESDTIEPSFQALAQVVVALEMTSLEIWTLCRIALLGRHTHLEDSSTTATEVAAQ